MSSRRPVPGSPLRLLQAAIFASTLDRFAMAPMLIAIAAAMGVPLALVVQAAGSYFAVYGLSQIAWGSIADRIGRVRTIRLTLALAGLATLATACTTSPIAFGIARGLAGGFFGACYPAALIYVGDTVAADRRQRAITRLMVGVAAGIALASVGAGLVAQVLTWRVAFVITGLAPLLLAWLLRSLPEPERTGPTSSIPGALSRIAHSPTTLLVLLFALAEGAVLLGVLLVLPAAIEHTGASAGVAGAITAGYGVAVFAFSALVARLTRSWSPAQLIALGAGAACVGCLVLAVSRQPGAALLGAALLGLGWASMHSTLQTWATEVLPEERATVVSLFAAALFIGSALGALLTAGPAERGAYPPIFVGYAALAIPLGAAATWLRAGWAGAGPQKA